MPDPLDLDALTARNTARRELKAGTSAGPWDASTVDVRNEMEDSIAVRAWVPEHELSHLGNYLPKDFRASKQARADARFIAAARSDPVEDDVDALVAEVRRLRANLEGTRGI